MFGKSSFETERIITDKSDPRLTSIDIRTQLLNLLPMNTENYFLLKLWSHTSRKNHPNKIKSVNTIPIFFSFLTFENVVRANRCNQQPRSNRLNTFHFLISLKIYLLLLFYTFLFNTRGNKRETSRFIIAPHHKTSIRKKILSNTWVPQSKPR